MTSNLFLHLLSAAIWDKPADATLFQNLDPALWKDISRMAHKQSVNALVADKALSLPEGSLPPREFKMQFVGQIEQTKAMNRKLIAVLSDLVKEYTEAGFPFVLMKGLANGINYPDVLLRNPGDIDILIYRNGDYENARKWLAGQGIEAGDAGRIHCHYIKDGIYIEPHWRIAYFDNKRYDRKFTAWEQELIEKDKFISSNIEDMSVRLLPVEMNAFFLYDHMFRHFISQGVGFRQFYDWILYLKRYRDQIDKESFSSLAKSYALLYPMQVFARVAVDYLGASEDIFPFEMIPPGQHVRMVLADILESGNFGFHRPGKKRPREKMRGMWFSYMTTVKRSAKYATFSPEHCIILPFHKLINRLKIGFNA